MIRHHPDHPGLRTYWSRPWAEIDPEYEQKPWERTVQERPATPDALFLIHARQIEGGLWSDLRKDLKKLDRPDIGEFKPSQTYAEMDPISKQAWEAVARVVAERNRD